jgi:hypothetical protein
MTEFVSGVDVEEIPSRTLFNTEKKISFDPPVYERKKKFNF